MAKVIPIGRGKKGKVPDHVSKWKKLSKKATQMIDTTNRHHRQAYDAAVEAVLVKDGYVNMDLMKDTKIQEKFAEKMADFYVSKAKQRFKSGKGAKFDDMEKELLIHAYAGTTKAQLTGSARELKKGFTFDQFYQKQRPKMMKGIEDALNSATISHFKDEHIGDILKYTKSEHLFDKSKMTINDALKVLGQYEGLGAVPVKEHKDEMYYIKEAA